LHAPSATTLIVAGLYKHEAFVLYHMNRLTGEVMIFDKGLKIGGTCGCQNPEWVRHLKLTLVPEPDGTKKCGQRKCADTYRTSAGRGPKSTAEDEMRLVCKPADHL